MKKSIGKIIWIVMLLTLLITALVACGTTVQSVDFTITFDVDGATYYQIKTQGSEVLAMPADPTKENYVFDGWYWDKDTWTRPFTASSLVNEPLKKDMRVYAKWIELDATLKTYTVTFNSMGGSAVDSVKVKYGKAITAPKRPTKTGYALVGWFKEANHLTKWDFYTDMVTADITLYAKWVDESDAAGCDILSATGFTSSGYDLSIKVPNSQEHFALSTAITVSPYAEWTVTSDIEGHNVVPSATVALIEGNNTYYINVVSGTGSNKKQYTVHIRRREMYTVTYVFNNGEENSVVHAEEDSKIENLQTEKTGYTFDKWQYEENAWDFENDIVNGDVILEAVWIANEYTVRFDSNGGSNVDSTAVTFGNAYSFTVPAKIGYLFNGWKTEQGDILTGVDGVSVATWNIANNTTVYAEWVLIEYTITYENTKNAINNNATKYTIESEDIILADLTVAGYTFGGWYENGTKVEKIIAGSCENMTLVAQLTPITYYATFMAEDVQVGERLAFDIENMQVTAPAVPEKAWYNGEWENYTLSLQDITIYAVYTPITYTISYLNTKGAANSNPTSYNIESDTITFSDITVAGYTFDGWYNGETKVESIAKGSVGNVMLSAKWTAISYTITYLYDNAIGDYAEGTAAITTYTIEDEFELVPLVCKTLGYTFDGWFTQKDVGTGTQVTCVSQGMFGDMTLYAQYGLEEYSIVYHNVNGAVNDNPTHYTIETETFDIYPLSKEGYTFDGWFADENCTQVANCTIALGSHGDIAMYAKWTPIIYTIDYVTYGGTTTGNPANYIITDSFVLQDATLSGYVFVGWYTAAEGGNKITSISTGTTGNIILYAHWDYISTITFQSNGGSAVESLSNVEGAAISAPTAPTKEHYNFAGWYSDAELTKLFTFVTQPTEDCTLYAKWTAVQYTIEYVLNGGTNHADNVATYTVEDKVELYAPSKVGYTFIGWFTDAEFTSTVVTELKVGTSGTITLYAHYSINQYTIRFESSGGTSVSAITQNYATDVTEPAHPAKNGYTFAGWYSNASLTSKYTFSTMPASDITLYAKWNLATYNITYNLNGGTNDSSNIATYTIASETITLKVPDKRGYNFAGWYTDAECTASITEIVSGSYGDVELFAKWEVIEYTIHYTVMDGTTHNNPIVYTIETDLTPLENASLAGYTFEGWYSDDAYTASVVTVAGGEIGNKTLYGKLTANTYDVWLDGNEEATYQVSFDLNGADGMVDMQTITPTNTLTYPTNPERAGYIFAGWYNNSECNGMPYNFAAMVVKDTTLYAKWIATEGAGVLNINGSAEINLDGATEQMLIFVPLVSGNVTITSAGDYDTTATLYNATMTKLIDNDDGGADQKNFQIVYNVTAGQAYYVGTRSYSATTKGKTVVSLSGNTVIADGGYTITTSKSSATYGQGFTFVLPAMREGYKFLGYADSNGVMYTDETGVNVRVWDKAEETILYSTWERTVYTATLKTTSSTVFATVTVPYGERLDLSGYRPTAEKRVFTGWMLDGVEYNASTMPDHNITLMARFANYTVSLKVDVNKKAVSVNDVVDGKLSATLFSAVAIENVNGSSVPMEFECNVNGSLTAGETISVMIQNREYQLRKTIDDIKVYDMPTLTIANSSKNYINPDEFTADAWGASGTDTYGEATEIKVYIDGEYTAGNAYTIVIASIDKAGNATYGYVENVKVYDVPVIVYNQEKTAISVNDTLNATLFTATAVDSFGEIVNVNVDIHSGTLTAGETVVIRLTAADSKGNVKTIDITCTVYGMPTISDATTTEFTESDSISADTLGLTAQDTYNNPLAITFERKEGEQKGGIIMVYTATVTDVAGNITTKEFRIRIYGTPTITVGRTDIKVTEDPLAPEYVVTFDLNGGQGSVASQTVTNEVGIEYPQIPTRSGYVFGGWYTTSGCEGTPYDFSSTITQNITLYAKWVSYSGKGCIVYNGSLKMSVVSKSSSTYDYYAFVPLVSGTVNIYSTGSLDTYGQLFNSTKKQLTYNDEDGDGSNFKISYAVTAGRLYYVRPCGYSSSGTTTVYISGIMPAQGGKAGVTGEPLNAIANDSFGSKLPLQITLQQGELKGGTEVVYLLSTIDKLGNSHSKPVTVRVYDENDIVLDYAEGYSSIVKRASKGEEFLASATDSFGGPCDITLEAAQGYTLEGGNTIDLYVVATDKAGNKHYSSLISNIKVYDTPSVVPEGVFVQEDTNLDFFYKVYDSFGEELFATITVTGEQKIGEIIHVTVTATDVAGNTVCSTYIYDILPVTIQYSLNADKQGYTLVKYSGSEASVIIPDSINGLPVVAIGAEAFANCSELTTITIPDSVTSIGEYAFSGCSGLTSITIPDGVTSIGEYAFSGCSGLTGITIPDSVTSIGASAFSGCSGLTSITLPFVGGLASATTASESTLFGYIFGTSSYSGATDTTQDYSSNSSVTYCIPASLKAVTITGGNILNGAFSECSGLTSVTIGNGVTSIGEYAFSGCSGLTSVTIGNGVTRIGWDAFYGCSGLKAVYITDMAKWCGISFGSYDANPLCYAHNLYLNGELVKDLAIPDSVTSIGSYAFYGCSGLTSITIPDGVTSIGEYAFYGCSGLTSITIPDSVTSIGGGTFFGCRGLNAVYITDIAKWCGISFGTNDANPLCYAPNLYLNGEVVKDLVIPDGVMSISRYAFVGFRRLTSVTIGSGVTSIGYEAFRGCSGLTSITIPDSVTSIGSWAFSGCSGLTSITIPDSVTSIGSWAFYGCTSLTEITIPFVGESRNASIYNSVFGYIFGYNTTTNSSWGISGATYQYCYKGEYYHYYIPTELKKVIINHGATSIGDYAFYNCSGLTSIMIPNSVTSIGARAFSVCSGLKTVYYTGSATDWEKISLESYNTNLNLTNATRYYYSETEPALNADGTTYDGNYWHYVDGVVTVWTKEN